MTAPILRLARITHGDSGRCACCDAPAAVWYRTGLLADGRLTVAARYCEAHDPDAHPTAAQRLSDLTIADVARLSPRRAQRAAAQIAAADARSKAHARRSADLAGASSATHTHRLFAALHEARADSLRALAALAEVTP